MNALVKKEIRLLLPAWSVAMLLAMVQGITRPYDFYVASLLFVGLTIMALSTIGRESSLSTFSLLLTQPAERIQIWKVKLTVLATAFLIVFMVWLVAFGIAFHNSTVEASDRENSYNLFITICLIAAAAFTGGLWTTLLLRQIAGAFWFTLMVPMTLSGFSAVFLANSESDSLVIAVLSVVIGIYSISGFLFARWLFFRAQDVGWSGGVITLPEWKIFTARAGSAGSVRERKPILALVKKEFQLHQVSLMGAAGLLVLHVGIMVFRTFHHFTGKDDIGEALSVVVLMAWLILVPLIGSMGVAEERRLGIMEAQLCLPVSRRVQYVIKAFLTLCLATFLGGILPVLLDVIGAHVGGFNSIFTEPDSGPVGSEIVAFAAWLALVSFFTSTLAKNFLQAVGLGIVTFFGCVFLIPLSFQPKVLFLDSNFTPNLHFLPLMVAVPTLMVTLLWLGYLNFNNFRDGWPLWRRNLCGIMAALLFILAGSNALYHRMWEIFEPAEPAHGPAKLAQAEARFLNRGGWSCNLLVRLPDGRVWFDYLVDPRDYNSRWWSLFRWSLSPLPKSMGPQRFISGSNWIAAAAHRIDTTQDLSRHGTNEIIHISGFSDSVGIQRDGTLWVSDKSDQKTWTADKLTQFGDETNWQKLAMRDYFTPVLLLKKDGTLWEWGPARIDPHGASQRWPGLRTLQPRQVGTNSDWNDIGAAWGFQARRNDGSIWAVRLEENGLDGLIRETNFDLVSSLVGLRNYDSNMGAYLRSNGSLWVYENADNHGRYEFRTWQSGSETNWVSVTASWEWMVALKSDGTLWKWNEDYYRESHPKFTNPPMRLGIHNDWVALSSFNGNAIALAADGSLWLWPNRGSYDYQDAMLGVPKQPQYLGNVFK